MPVDTEQVLRTHHGDIYCADVQIMTLLTYLGPICSPSFNTGVLQYCVRSVLLVWSARPGPVAEPYEAACSGNGKVRVTAHT